MPVPTATPTSTPAMKPQRSDVATSYPPETAEKLFKAWPKRALIHNLDMGEASREEGFRLNGSR